MAAMAVIFDPQGPLSLPCENTTTPTQETPVCCRYRRMALDEEQSSASHELRRAIDCLRDCADLAGVDAASLEVLAAGAVHFSLPAGSVLFESGSTPDGVYLVASGRLGVTTSGVARLTAEIGRNELVGEAGWLLHEQRSATVVALRDSELLHVPESVSLLTVLGILLLALAASLLFPAKPEAAATP